MVCVPLGSLWNQPKKGTLKTPHPSCQCGVIATRRTPQRISRTLVQVAPLPTVFATKESFMPGFRLVTGLWILIQAGCVKPHLANFKKGVQRFNWWSDALRSLRQLQARQQGANLHWYHKALSSHGRGLMASLLFEELLINPQPFCA